MTEILYYSAETNYSEAKKIGKLLLRELLYSEKCPFTCVVKCLPKTVERKEKKHSTAEGPKWWRWVGRFSVGENLQSSKETLKWKVVALRSQELARQRRRLWGSGRYKLPRIPETFSSKMLASSFIYREPSTEFGKMWFWSVWWVGLS